MSSYSTNSPSSLLQTFLISHLHPLPLSFNISWGFPSQFQSLHSPATVARAAYNPSMTLPGSKTWGMMTAFLTQPVALHGLQAPLLPEGWVLSLLYSLVPGGSLVRRCPFYVSSARSVLLAFFFKTS